MSHIFAIANQKGGVGKTTTAVNLAASLAATKRRVLLIDLDPQGNATMGCGVDKYDIERSMYDVLVGNCTAVEARARSEEAGFDVLPGNGDLTAAEVELMEVNQREQRLLKALEPIRDEYDYILIDCPPSLNMLTLNALVAAQGVLIPMQCEYYALEGLSALIQTITSIQSGPNPELDITGLIRTMYDPRNSLTRDVSEQLSEHFGKALFTSVIPRNVRLAEAPSHGLPVLNYDKSSKGAMAYLALAGELNRRMNAAAKQQAVNV